MNNQVVVDASVILAWVLQERLAQETKKLYQDLFANKVSFVGPGILFYEVANGIRSALLARRIVVNDIKQAWQRFIELQVSIVNQEEGEDILITAADCNLSVYDAAYLVLARNLELDLITSDDRLKKLL